MEPLVSIIVPVYNVEDYVTECIKSILNQTYRNIEVLIVDDGSTDASLKECKKFELVDGRIRIFHQQNKGVVAARKLGVSNAIGEYVFFVDADDYVDSSLLESLLECADGYDLVTSGYLKGETAHFDTLEKGNYVKKEELEYLISHMIAYDKSFEMGIIRSFWAKLFRRDKTQEVFSDLKENIFCGEDGDFLYRYILQCDSIKITHLCGYHYRVRKDSVMHSINKNYLKNIGDLYNSLEPIFLQHALSETLVLQLQKWINQMILSSGDYLGFSREIPNYSYLYPLIKETVNKKIVLYGMGKVGKCYKAFIEKTDICDIVLWVDSKWDLKSLDELNNDIYDFVVIAVLDEKTAKEIQGSLLQRKISKEKILWKKPI